MMSYRSATLAALTALGLLDVGGSVAHAEGAARRAEPKATGKSDRSAPAAERPAQPDHSALTDPLEVLLAAERGMPHPNRGRRPEQDKRATPRVPSLLDPARVDAPLPLPKDARRDATGGV